MGSEQSSQSGNQNASGSRTRTTQLRRGKSVPNRDRVPEDEVSSPRCISPGASICSDSDLPYISYTVNRPIGDSPKMSNKQSQLYRGKSLGGPEISRRKNGIGTINHKYVSCSHITLSNVIIISYKTRIFIYYL